MNINRLLSTTSLRDIAMKFSRRCPQVEH